MGRRLGEYTRHNTKCMVEVNGVKIIDRMLGQLDKLNLERIVIVAGYKGDNLKQHIAQHHKGKTRIEFIDNPVYARTNNIYSLYLAKDELVKDDTLLIESDLVFSDNIFRMALESKHPNVALVAKYEQWMDGTMVYVDSCNNITDFISKKDFDYADIDRYYKTVNIYKFGRDFSAHTYLPFLEAYCKARGNNEYYEQVLKVITLLDDCPMKALPIGHEKWYEIDDLQDLDIAETIFAADSCQPAKYAARYGGYWRFPQMLDFCYLVNPFFPPQRMTDELKSNFDVLLTGYPSGMRVNNILAAKNFKVKPGSIITGNGAAELIKAVMEGAEGKTGIVYPTFEEYPHRAKAPSLIVPFMPQGSNLRYTAAHLKDFFADKGISQLLLINPDNPTGNYIPKDDVIGLAGWCRERGITLILDESFVDFTDGSSANSLISNSILEEFPNMIVVKSISKSYGVPGLRLGVMACADTAVIGRVKKQLPIWNINSFAEYYMQIYGKYENDYKEACALFIEERNRFFGELSRIPYLEVMPSQANYFCCRLKGRFTSAQLTEKLLAGHNILIKDCDNKTGLAGTNCIRIAVRGRKDNDTLIRILKQL